MEIQRTVLEALSGAQDSVGLCLDGSRSKGLVYKLRSPLSRGGYVAALVKPDGQTLEIVGVWNRKGRPTWITPRIVGSEGLFHLIERADHSVRSSSWRGRDEK